MADVVDALFERTMTPVPSLKVAERGGFEPRNALALNGFQDRRIQPLCHLSVSRNDSIVLNLHREGER